MKGIRFKLWIYTSLLLLSLLGLTYIMQSTILDRFYISRESGNLRDQAKKLVDILESQDSKKDISAEMEYIASLNGGRASVYDENGRLLAYAGHYMQGRLANIEADMIQGILQGREEQNNETMAGMQVNIVSIGIPVMSGGKVKGAVFLHSPSTPMQQAVIKVKRQFLLLFALALFISALGAVYISRHFTNPIIGIKLAAEKIAKGDYKARADIKAQDEFRELADTINKMAGDLEKTERLRRDFIANVSHEFRTPLGIIKGFAEALSDNVVPEEEKKEYADAIIEESTRLNNMVNGILDLSKIESGNLKVNKEEFNLWELVQEIIGKLSIISGNREVSFDGEKAFILGDRDMIGRAILNIIGNAIDHTADNGKIDINLNKNNGIILTISDNGTGIDKEHLPYIFERFYRAKNTRGGSGGLGLSISQEIIKAHGGEIEVESEKGKGTKFVVKLNWYVS